MANKSDKSDLGYLGQEFQYKLIHTLMEDKNFFKDLHSIIDQNMFTDAYLKTFVGVMKDQYETQENVPSYSIMGIALNDKAPNDTEREIYQETIKKLQSTPTDGVDYIRELAEKFFRQQNIIKTANEILKIAGNGDTSKYERCVDLLNEALNKGTKEEDGTTVMTDVNETLSDDYRTPIPTGVGKIDETLEGGLGKGELGVIVGPTSFGKALSVNELLCTPTGFIRNGDINVGDLVINKNGLPTKVIGVYPQGERSIYKVTFSDGSLSRCDFEHLWNVRCKNQIYKTLPLYEIINHLSKVNDKKKFYIPTCDNVFFEEREVSINPYFLGTILSSENLKYDEDDEINGLLSNYFDSDEIFIPTDYQYNSIDNRIMLLQGIMDGNGAISNNGKMSYQSKSERLINDIKTLVLSLGGNIEIKIVKGMFRITFTFKENNFKIFTKPQKEEKRLNITNDRYIKSIEFDGNEDALCIKVEAEDELYLTNDFIVTHNTSLTTAMASHAATFKCPNNNNQGYKVLQIVFEDRIKQIQRKHIGRITGVEAKDLSKPEHIVNVREQLEKYQDKELLQNNLRIVKFPSGEITPSFLVRYIKKLINKGFKPDMCIVDYFECLANETNSANEYSDEGRTMRKIEAMASELDIAVWVPSQGTKESINCELVTMDKMGGSVKKAQIAHVIMSIARTVEDIERNLATIAILKNRAGQSGKVYNNVEFNNGTCRISTDNVDEFDSMVKFNENKAKETIALQKAVFKATQK